MAISTRTLNKWRREALVIITAIDIKDNSPIQVERKALVSMTKSILIMTQELLDQRLLEKEPK